MFEKEFSKNYYLLFMLSDFKLNFIYQKIFYFYIYSNYYLSVYSIEEKKKNIISKEIN
jgi:hypothetical protein